ncbi:uncharacterized protein LOC129875566 [Solanum dulcamara]|uniref:uncharacterized protein LOC129875566 n=1 Tax=Solanum dulcamara TaxID=45834 RepID=UPI00248698F5|nr:uncharacterized protein LOC129875566 [Solanum dulcamara]
MVRKEMQKLNQKEFMGVSDKVRLLRNALTDKQTQMRNASVPQNKLDEEKQLRLELTKWSLIETKNGIVLREPTTITKQVVGFYKKLIGQTTIHMRAAKPEVMKAGHVLTRAQQLELIKSFTDIEVKQALKSIGDSKEPGEDGFNSYFFKQTWPVTGEEITAAVLDFFQTSEMYAPISRTSVILIPKVQHPISIKEYISISCCTSIYKIISKMLTNRL